MEKIFGSDGALYAIATFFLIGLPLADGDLVPALGRAVVGGVAAYLTVLVVWNFKKFLDDRRGWPPPQQRPDRKTP